MSLIRRRKSPGWGKTPIKRTVRVVKKRKKMSSKSKTVKIVNPISKKKINLNGPTHKRLIKEKVLDLSGVDIREDVRVEIRSKKITPKPKPKSPKPKSPKPKSPKPKSPKRQTKSPKSPTKPKPKSPKPQPKPKSPKPQLKPKSPTKPKPKSPTKPKPKSPKPKPKSPTPTGNITRFSPKKTKELPNQNLLNYSFDLSDYETCLAFADSDFDLLMKNPNLDRQALLECVVKRGMAGKVKILLKDERSSAKGLTGVDPSISNDYYVRYASRMGYVQVVRELLKDHRVYPGGDNDYALRTAIRGGYPEVVDELLKDPRVDPSVDSNKAIRWASQNGYLSLVKELLKDSRVDPIALNNSAIVYANQNGHTLVVKELLKDPRVRNTQLFRE